MKVLYWEGDGFVLLYKRLENGKFVWPRNKDEVMNLLENIRNAFEKNETIYKKDKLKYTVSIGCSFEFGENLDEMIQKADVGLYDAKNSGRNKVRYR